MVSYRMIGRDADSNPTQYRVWVSSTPDFIGQQYTGIKSGNNPLVDVLVYAVFDDTAVVDFNLPLGDAWSTTYKVLPISVSDSQLAVIDGYAYLFGGNLTDKIFQADIENPADWVDTGATLPAPLFGSQLAIVDSTIYLFGGNDGYGPTDVIYSASTSDPLTWSDQGHLLPDPLQYSSLGMMGGSLYLFGGQNEQGITSNIYTANTSTPLVWSNSGQNLVDPVCGSHIAQLDGYWVLMGGWTATATPSQYIWQAPVGTPYDWSLDGYLPYPIAFGQFFTVGNYGFLIGPVVGAAPTGLTPIMSYINGSVLQFLDTQLTVPGLVSNSQVAIIYDRVWLLGGNGSSVIFVCDQEIKYDYDDYIASSYGYNTRTVLQMTDNLDNPFQAIGMAYWKTSYLS